MFLLGFVVLVAVNERRKGSVVCSLMVGFTCSGLLDRGMQCVVGLPVIMIVARFLF